ncbi:MAG: hypothetical protein GTO49_24935, partial [Anaerolineae bacterium]|nr:hypothetical protein [Anaerolineae bacterium]
MYLHVRFPAIGGDACWQGARVAGHSSPDREDQDRACWLRGQPRAVRRIGIPGLRRRRSRGREGGQGSLSGGRPSSGRRKGRNCMTSIRTGLSGGQYEPLAEDEIERIHQTSMRVFEHVGMEVTNEAARHRFREAGARVEGDRVTFPSELVMEILAEAPSRVDLCGRESR